MDRAIELAKDSAKNGGFALGALIVKNGEIISEGKTQLVGEVDPTAHAEMNVIREACKKLNSYYLEDCVLYTTHEPCPMCTSAAIWARMEGIIFGATIEDAMNSKVKKYTWRQINLKARDVAEKGDPKIEIIEEFCRKECNELFKLS